MLETGTPERPLEFEDIVKLQAHIYSVLKADNVKVHALFYDRSATLGSYNSFSIVARRVEPAASWLPWFRIDLDVRLQTQFGLCRFWRDADWVDVSKETRLVTLARFIERTQWLEPQK